MSRAASNPALQTLVREQIDAWREADEADAAGFLAVHPELAKVESLVLDLVQEEYCIRTKAGRAFDKDGFCDRFPGYRRSIEQMLEVEQFLDQCPQFALDKDQVAWPAPGEEFLGFAIKRELGSGTFARVFFAREPALGNRPVVIKVSRYGMYEAGTLGKLSHPAIMPIHSVQYDKSTGWTAICMPLLGTATAVDLLQAAFAEGRPTGRARCAAVIGRVAMTTRPIPGVTPAIAEQSRELSGEYADAIARMGLQLAEGLQQAHGAGIRHHDIKPSNVLLDWAGRPQLLDFNLALDDLAVVNRPGGTVEYLAPELAAKWQDRSQREALREDARCDIYSLGAVLYQLLVNRLPRLAKDGDGNNARRAGVPALRSIDPAIDARLDAIVLKCLAIEPGERYRTAAELASALRGYLSVPATARRFATRHRREFLAASVALGLAGAAGAALVATRKPYSERLLERGFAEYERGDYSAALAVFDRCVELERNSPEVRFARGQALLRLEKWDDARADFAEVRHLHPGWSYALMGYCQMRAGDLSGAFGGFNAAYKAGVRDLRLLLNYADVQQRRRYYPQASDLYTEALSREPSCSAAYRGRAHAMYCMAFDRRKVRVLPNRQVFVDTREDVRLNPNEYLSFFLGATIFGYAVQVDPSLHEIRYEGSDLLKQALLNGLPFQTFEGARARLEPLMTDEIWRLVARAPARRPGVVVDHYVNPEFPQLARWSRFLGAVSVAP